MHGLVPYNAANNFQVYRPDRISSRLEPTYGSSKDDEWRPSLHYGHRLHDIKNQFTPSENYRHQLKTSGAFIRMIQRLEMRWTRRIEEFTKASIDVQRVYRGMMGRRYFIRIKDIYYDDMLRRRYTKPTVAEYEEGNYEKSLDYIAQAPSPIGELLETVKVKCLYRLKNYEDCIQASISLRGTNPLSSDSYFYHALSFAQLQRLDEAFEVTRDAILRVTSCADEIFRLSAGLAVQLHPPNFDAAIDGYGELLRRNPRDFEALLARASCFCCLQDWSEALADIQNVLAFLPVHRQAMILRARIHACNRRWAEAEKDYQSITYFEPQHPEALEGLQEIIKFEADNVLYIEH